MKKMIMESLLLGATALFVAGCTQEELKSGSQNANTTSSETAATTMTAVAQTASQLASGTSFRISGSTSDSSGVVPAGSAHHHGGSLYGLLDGINLLAPTNELLAVIEAESAGDFRGLHMHSAGGATVTNYDQSGNVVSLPLANSGGPEGCSFSGGQFPKYDSLLSTVARTVIDFGSGVTEKHDSVTITRVGKIIITRNGDSTGKTETVTFESYTVNGNLIEGTKTRVSTFVKANGTATGISTTTVSGGKITFNDGTVTTWTGNKERKSSIVLDSNDRPLSGAIATEGSAVVTGSDGSVIYSHRISKTLTEDIACRHEHHGPVSGTVEILYKTNTITIDFGDGSCSNDKVTVTINGVTTSKTVGG